MANRPATLPWLALCRHRVRGFAPPFLLILQHHIVESQTRIVAPVVPAGPDEATLLAPAVEAGGTRYRAMLLDMTSVPLGLLGQVVDGSVNPDHITAAVDALFRGYPVGLPLR